MSKKILLCVDDDADTLKLRKLVFEATDYSVVTASSGEQALTILAEGPVPDIVILDYMMPSMRGDELAMRIRREHPELPIIAVSAVGQLPEPFLQTINGSVQKGQDPQVLLSKVSALLNPRSAEAAGRINKTILCVEDEPLQLELRKLLFEAHGYTVLTAASAQAASESFLSSHVDAVVMDYWLSGQSGTTVAQQMKRIRPRVPILILSGFASLPGEGTVVDSWIRKAEIEPENLVKEVERLIDLRTTSRQSERSA